MNGRTRLGSTGPAGATWLGAHPITGSVVITVLTGLGLQLTHLIDFEERMSAVVGWTLQLRFIDFAFRMVLGVLVVLLLLPLLFGYLRRRPWLLRYLRHMRLTVGHTPRLTVTATAVSAVILVALVAGFGAYLGVLEVDPDSWAEDSRWFVVILMLVPGIWEELAFRGLMLANLRQRYGPWVAIVITGTLFGLMHLTDLVNNEPSEVVFEVVMATALGIAWGYLTVTTGSVAPAMILHYSVNVLIELLLRPELTDTAGAAIFGSVTIAYPVLTMITAWSLARMMSRDRTPIAARWEREARPG